jgi:nicotinamide riboside kinase
MLSSVLKSKRAIQINVHIMRVFTELREMLLTHRDLREKIEAMESKYDKRFRVVFEAIRRLVDEKDEPVGKIGFREEKQED